MKWAATAAFAVSAVVGLGAGAALRGQTRTLQSVAPVKRVHGSGS